MNASSRFALLESQGRVEPALLRGSYSAIPPVTLTAAGPSSADSEADAEPRLFAVVPPEPPPSEARHGVTAERPHVASAFLLLVGLVIAAIVGVYFGISFSLLTRSNDKTIAAAAPASSGGEEVKSTPTVTTAPGDRPPSTMAAAETAPAPDAISHEPAPPPPPLQASGPPAAAGFARPPGEPTRNASGSNRSGAHPATRRGGSAHHQAQPSPQVENQRMLSATMGRARRENFTDSSATLTPPHAGATSPFDQLITHLTGQAKPAESLTLPRARQP